MGIFNIEIKKILENENEVTYSFQEYDLPGTGFGEILINKRTGELIVIKEAEWDKNNKGGLSLRAGTKILQHWRKGEFPEITGWVS